MVQQFAKFICYYMLYGAFRVLNLESVFWHSVNLSIVLGRHVPGNSVSAEMSGSVSGTLKQNKG